MKYFLAILLSTGFFSLYLTSPGYTEDVVRVAIFGSDLPALSSFDTSFDPDSYTLISQIHDGLIHLNLDGKLIPGLATEWKQIDPKTYELKLRQGVKFHNGMDFTSKDVKFTLDTILNPKTKSGTKWILDTIESVETPDDYTVIIKTKAPDGMLLYRLGIFSVISSKEYVEKAGLDQARKFPIGTGPFKFIKHIPGKEYILESNKNYWRPGIPSYDRLVFAIMPETEWAKALKNKSIDLVPNLSGKKTEEIAADPNLAVQKRLVLQSYWILLKNTGPLAKLEVRQALNIALDRAEMIKQADQGNGLPQASIGMRGELGYNQFLRPYKYDIQKAKELLAAAGYPNGFTVNMLASEEAERAAMNVKEQLAKIGVIINLEVVSRPEWATRVVVGKITGNPYEGEMVMNLVDNPIIDLAFHAGLFLHSQSPWALLNSPEFDQRFQLALEAPSLEEHERRLKELDKYIYENALLLFTYQAMRSVGLNKRIKIPGIDLNGHVDFLFLSDTKILKDLDEKRNE
jgi:peptide/nickel transport system substrate-binding protein